MVIVAWVVAFPSGVVLVEIKEAVIIAAEQFQFGPVVGALDGDAE